MENKFVAHMRHLINRLVASFEEAFAKTERQVINDFGLLIGTQFLIVSVWRNKAWLITSIHGEVFLPLP